MAPAERIAFWASLHARLARLANRLDAEAQGTILAAIHARIPMPTQDENHAEQYCPKQQARSLWDQCSILLPDLPKVFQG